MDLLINTYGTRIRSSNEHIVIFFPKTNKKKEYPARRIEKIIILSPSSISMGAVQLALEHDIDIVYLGQFGKPIGRFFPSTPKGISKLRKAQLEVSNSEKAIKLAKTIVKGKATNQIDYLKYLKKVCEKDLKQEIIQAETLLDSISIIPDSSDGKKQLFGIEGYIAERYFNALKKIYKFPGRKPRGRDKFNSALNYGYGILYNEIEQACLYTGLDPYLGLYHSERYGKPSLVLDLIEEFRVPLVDSVIFPLFAEKILTKENNFKKIEKDVYQLSQRGKGILVESMYTKFNTKILWGGRRKNIKDIIRHQVLMLAHVFMGKKKQYKPFIYKPAPKQYE